MSHNQVLYLERFTFSYGPFSSMEYLGRSKKVKVTLHGRPTPHLYVLSVFLHDRMHATTQTSENDGSDKCTRRRGQERMANEVAAPADARNGEPLGLLRQAYVAALAGEASAHVGDPMARQEQHERIGSANGRSKRVVSPKR
jgi:hypothetical protein